MKKPFEHSTPTVDAPHLSEKTVAPNSTEAEMEKFEKLARAAGYTMDENRSVVPVDPDQEGFWEDWEACCAANGL